MRKKLTPKMKQRRLSALAFQRAIEKCPILLSNKNLGFLFLEFNSKIKLGDLLI
jgi:hypothetical protein